MRLAGGDVWGDGYKIAVVNLKGRWVQEVMEDSKQKEIARALFSEAQHLGCGQGGRHLTFL